MFERFTKDARIAVVLAQEEARELGHPSIGAEHILLGVLASPYSSADFWETLHITHEGMRTAVAQQHRGDDLGEQDAEALRSIGIDLDAVRATLEANFGPDVLNKPTPKRPRGWFGRSERSVHSHLPFGRDAKKALELSLREALARKDKNIRSEHILLGVLRDPTPVTVTALAPYTTPEALRRLLIDRLDRAA